MQEERYLLAKRFHVLTKHLGVDLLLTGEKLFQLDKHCLDTCGG
jgi:hypothetical protein